MGGTCSSNQQAFDYNSGTTKKFDSNNPIPLNRSQRSVKEYSTCVVTYNINSSSEKPENHMEKEKFKDDNETTRISNSFVMTVPSPIEQELYDKLMEERIQARLQSFKKPVRIINT